MTWVVIIYCGGTLLWLLAALAGERARPGKTGRILVRQRRRVRDLRPLPMLRQLGLGLLCLGGCAWLFYDAWLSVSGERFVLALGLFVAYLIASDRLDPQPDLSNMGYYDGIVDDPLQLSDDYNRWLRSLQVALIPGRLMIDGIGDALLWLLTRGSGGPEDTDDVGGQGPGEETPPRTKP